MEDENTVEEISGEKSLNDEIAEINEFVDFTIVNKIINKLTDYAEFIPESKIAGIINFNFRLNSSQTNQIISFLESIQAITRIFNLALKGSRDLEAEFISNIFSDNENPDRLSSYQNLRNIIENRLSHQTQQYNMNMGKTNTTLAMPLNELRGHVQTYRNMSENNLSVSTKAQHGIIAASLHDAYTIILNRQDYWNDRTYMKFFFNEDDISKRKSLILRKEKRLSLKEIADKINESLDISQELSRSKSFHFYDDQDGENLPREDFGQSGFKQQSFVDRMLMTPFGKQYGNKIDGIIRQIFDPQKRDLYDDAADDLLREKIQDLYKSYLDHSNLDEFNTDIINIVDYLLYQGYGIKTFAEKFLFNDRKESFSKFFSGKNQEIIEQFITEMFIIYFEYSFSSLFKIIKSADMKKFACAFIIKRFYLKQGENLTYFGFFLIRAIAKIGGIRVQS